MAQKDETGEAKTTRTVVGAHDCFGLSVFLGRVKDVEVVMLGAQRSPRSNSDSYSASRLDVIMSQRSLFAVALASVDNSYARGALSLL